MKKIICYLLALMLTGSLILFGLTFLVRRVTMPALAATPAGDDIIQEQQRLIEARIHDLSGIYGFSPEPVTACIREDTLRELNAQAADWIRFTLTEGTTGEELNWDTDELVMILEEDATISGMEDRDQADDLVMSAAAEISRSVVRTVLPLRQQVILLGMQRAGRRVDLSNLFTFLLGMPWAALALSALLAGLIALLECRRMRRAFSHIGAALVAASIWLVAFAVLWLSAGVQPMIREASESLALIYQNALNRTLIYCAAMVLIMAAGGGALLAGGRRKQRI